MPGTTPPSHGLQGFWSRIQELTNRITSLEVWQRQMLALEPGVITQWGGATAPGGALLCNGATFSAVTYPLLAQALGGTTLPNITGTPIHIIWT